MSIRALVQAQTLIYLGEEATVTEAAKIMTDKKIGSIVVLKGQSLVGIFTERDLLNRVVAQGLECQTTLLKSVMTTGVVTVNITITVEECYKQMQEKNFRHLPVVENDQVLGIISMRNLLGLMLQQLSYERDLLKQCMDK